LTKKTTYMVLTHADECVESVAKVGNDTFHIKSYFGGESLKNLLFDLVKLKLSRDHDMKPQLCYNGNGEKIPV